MKKGSKVENPWNIGIARSEETKHKISESLKGNIISTETRNKISQKLKGIDNRKGNHFVSEVTRKKLSLLSLGKKRSLESRRKMSIAMKGKNAGKCRPTSDQTKLKISQSNKGKKRPELAKIKDSIIRTAQWKNEKYVNQQMISRHIFPNKPETKVLNKLNGLFPNEWKYTGDLSFMINGKNPDFVNCNGQKKIIELYGDYWHKNDDPQNRIDIFAEFGYETLIIWESELKDEVKLIEKLNSFCIWRG